MTSTISDNDSQRNVLKNVKIKESKLMPNNSLDSAHKVRF